MTIWPHVAAAATALVEALAWQALFATVVFAVVALLCRALRRRGPALRHALWGLVFLRLLLPPDLSHPYSAGAMTGRLADGPWIADGGAAETAVALHPELDVPSAGPAVRSPAAGGWAVALAALWLAGVAASLSIYRRRYRTFQTVLRRAATVDDHRLLALAETWRRRLGIRRPVRLVTDAARVSPFTTGCLKPVIFLPATVLAARDERTIESVLAHELAHVARWDSLWLSTEHLLKALYFFHPAVWVAGRKLDQERERLCDALALSHGDLPAKSYAASLLAVARLDLRGLAAANLTTRKRRLTMRIRDILVPRRDPGSKPAALAALFLALFLLPLAGGAAPGVPQETAIEETPTATSDAAATPALANPLPGSRVSSTWGERRNPWSGEVVFHRGIDLVAETGTAIRAPADGVVAVATTRYEPQEAAGTVLILDHGGGFETYYAHLGTLEVDAGQRVSRHDTVARVGTTGRTTGPHLHFETWRRGEPVDPAEMVPEWSR